MLAGREGKIFKIGDDEMRDFFRCDGEKAIVATTSAGRFTGVAESLWRFRGRDVSVLQIPINNADAEPRARRELVVDKHVMGVSVWKFLAVRDRVAQLLTGTKVTVISGDVGKTDGHKFYEKPGSFEEAMSQARFLMGKPHFIISALTKADLDFDGYDGRVDVVSTWSALPVWTDEIAGNLESYVGLVPGGFDFFRFGTLQKSRVACRKEEGCILPDERGSLTFEGVEWQSGTNLWMKNGRRGIIAGMIAPRSAVKRLMTM